MAENQQAESLLDDGLNELKEEQAAEQEANPEVIEDVLVPDGADPIEQTVATEEEDVEYERPEYFPEKFWNEADGPDIEGLVNSYRELEKNFSQGKHKAPEEGYDISFAEQKGIAQDDALLGKFQGWAKEHGVSQAAFEALAKDYIDTEMSNLEQYDTDVRAEKAKLGPDAKLNSTLNDMVRDNPIGEVELLESTIKDLETGVYHYQLCFVKEKYELLHRELKSSPWVISRYMKAAGEVHGRGPLTVAIPDIKTLNKVKELLLKNASLGIAGVYTAADDGVLNPNTVTLKPGAIIPVARNGGPQGESLKPLPRSGDPQLSQIVIDQLQMSIKKILLDESIPRDDMSARSATEIQQRIQELAQNLGSAFGRLITETMNPIIERTLAIMDEQGLIQMPLKVNGLEIKLKPVSPIAMSQNSTDIENVIQYAQIVSQLGPEGQTVLKIGKIADYIADKLGIPMTLVNSEMERMQIIQQTQELAMQAAQAEAEAGQEQQVPQEDQQELPME